ncbi:MAG: electron transfer flavoprotein subunit beta/FixA family protein [Candidatus Thermoplasmatota archaeon]|nr:electron transfer flavoprotein subunit beta/FixA family protein [Candidatus Thermoplasmatota archaeon]MEE3134494.1 electron transfer flavoprotein subunit beta/FixA family protein [Candidatus Thermoplasmatota archaeon]
MVEIVVLVKQVPDTNAKIEIKDGRADLSMIKWITSPYDEYALEVALQHKEAVGGSVTALTLGPARCDKTLKDAKALGVDKIARIDVDEGYVDSFSVQSMLAEACKSLGAEVVYCGKAAADTNAGSTGPGVAEKLGWASVANVTKVVFADNSLELMQPAPEGQAKIGVNLPAVITCDKGMGEPRRANVKGIMMAKRAVVDLIDTGNFEGNTSVIEHTSPPQKPPGKSYEGSEHVSEVVKLLRDEANVI